MVFVVILRDGIPVAILLGGSPRWISPVDLPGGSPRWILCLTFQLLDFFEFGLVFHPKIKRTVEKISKQSRE